MLSVSYEFFTELSGCICALINAFKCDDDDDDFHLQ